MSVTYGGVWAVRESAFRSAYNSSYPCCGVFVPFPQAHAAYCVIGPENRIAFPYLSLHSSDVFLQDPENIHVTLGYE